MQEVCGLPGVRLTESVISAEPRAEIRYHVRHLSAQQRRIALPLDL